MKTALLKPLINKLGKVEGFRIAQDMLVIINEAETTYLSYNNEDVSGYAGIPLQTLKTEIDKIIKEVGAECWIVLELHKNSIDFKLVFFHDAFNHKNSHIAGWPEILPTMVKLAKKAIKQAVNKTKNS